MTSITRALTIGIFALVLGGCLPGGSGWECQSSRDCDSDLSCAAFTGGHYCVESGASSISSKSTYGWFGMVAMWGFALALLGGFTVTQAKQLKHGGRGRTRAIVTMGVAYAAIAVILVLVLSHRHKRGEGSGSYNGVVAKFRDMSERMCKCTDTACADRVDKSMVELGGELAKHASEAKADDAAVHEMTDLMARMAECRIKASRPAAP